MVNNTDGQTGWRWTQSVASLCLAQIPCQQRKIQGIRTLDRNTCEISPLQRASWPGKLPSSGKSEQGSNRKGSRNALPCYAVLEPFANLSRANTKLFYSGLGWRPKS